MVRGSWFTAQRPLSPPILSQTISREVAFGRHRTARAHQCLPYAPALPALRTWGIHVVPAKMLFHQAHLSCAVFDSQSLSEFAFIASHNITDSATLRARDFMAQSQSWQLAGHNEGGQIDSCCYVRLLGTCPVVNPPKKSHSRLPRRIELGFIRAAISVDSSYTTTLFGADTANPVPLCF